jgi:hypothetical protein
MNGDAATEAAAAAEAAEATAAAEAGAAALAVVVRTANHLLGLRLSSSSGDLRGAVGYLSAVQCPELETSRPCRYSAKMKEEAEFGPRAVKMRTG